MPYKCILFLYSLYTPSIHNPVFTSCNFIWRYNSDWRIYLCILFNHRLQNWVSVILLDFKSVCYLCINKYINWYKSGFSWLQCVSCTLLPSFSVVVDPAQGCFYTPIHLALLVVIMTPIYRYCHASSSSLHMRHYGFKIRRKEQTWEILKLTLGEFVRSWR
jgi:hypothetical protein